MNETNRHPPRLLLVLAVLLACWGPAVARAQTNSLFGSRGPAGQIGSNLNGSMVGQSTTLASPLGGALGGQALGGQALGGTTAGATQAGGAAAGFVGRGDAAGRFVGDQRQAQQRAGNANQRQFGQGGARGGNRGGGRFGDTAAADASQRRQIRPRQEVAFAFTPRQPTVVTDQFNVRIAEISQRQTGLQGVTVQIDAAGLAVLRGTVDTAESKKLAALLAQLEPGVRTVQNDLVVRQ